MNIKIEIDTYSGFCFGVTTAINKAEEELRRGHSLYCLGDIVHNGMEVERLKSHGLISIDHEALKHLHNTKVLLRAHGEPPETYEIARRRQIEIIDATCPVVLRLQKRIRAEYMNNPSSQIAIFGGQGHAEVLGLVGQTQGKAIVLKKLEDVSRLDMNRNISLFSQTTKSLREFRQIVDYIVQHIIPPAQFNYYDTICRQVSGRMNLMMEFARQHDAILFVCGKKSSNGKALYESCLSVNLNSYFVEGPDDIDFSKLEGIATLGICGATSTPKWLMESCKTAILSHP